MPLLTATGLAVLFAGTSPDVWGSAFVVVGTPGIKSQIALSNGAVVMDGSGHVHVAFLEQDAPRLGVPNQRHQIYIAEYDALDHLLAVDQVVQYREDWPGGADTGAKWPSLAAAPDGSLHLAWHDYRVGDVFNTEVYYKARPAGEAWDSSPGADLRLTTSQHPETLGDNGFLPTIRVAPDGGTRVVWFDFRYDGHNAEILSKARPAGGEWDLRPGDIADERITDNLGASEYPDFTFDAAGSAHAVWTDNTPGAFVILHSLLAAEAGHWSAPLPISDPGVIARNPAVASTPDGVHCVWEDSREGSSRIYASHFRNGVWSPNEPVSPPGCAASAPALAGSADGKFHLAWSDRREGFFDNVVWYQRREGQWDGSGLSDVRISPSTHATDPSIGVGEDGSVAIAWRETSEDPLGDVWGRIARAEPTGLLGAAPPRNPARALGTPSPNPFNPIMTLPVEVSDPGLFHIRIHDAGGRLVASLWDGWLTAGKHQFRWAGTSRRGQTVCSGRYTIILDRPHERETTSVVLLK